MARKCKNRDRQQFYMCIGESFKHNVKIGDCGDVKTLIGWLEHLYPRQDRDELERFFDDSYTNNDVCDYIQRSCGKRLKAI